MTSTGIVQPEDAKYIKRRVKSGTIDVHPTETALIVNYEVEAVILGESENPVLSDRKDCQKIIRLKSLNRNSDCVALAREVINKCSLIHPSKIAEVEHLIYFLQSRKENAFSGSIPDNSVGSNIGFDSSQNSSTPVGEKAKFSKLGEYVELLYEDLPEKVKGAALIMQLSRDHDNLEELARSDAVLSALARVLREDFKKSMDLSFNIISIFHSFSLFTQFHPLILQYKIGSLCIGIAELELQRYNGWKSELGTQRESRREVPSKLPLPRRSSTPSPAPPADRKKMSLLPVPKSSSSPRPAPTGDEDSNQRKILAMIVKQDRLLKVNFSLLLNIAENIKVEDKIRKRNVVAMLVQCLERTNTGLLVIVAKFLMKLSIRLENKDEMGNLNVIEKLPKLLQMNNYDLEKATLGLLFNLSFDTKLRDKMIRVGFLQKFDSLLCDERHTKIVLKLMYHLSMDDRVKAMFTFTDCLPKLMKMLVGQERESEDWTLAVAVCINVALNSRCADIMVANGRNLEPIRHTALAYQDVLLMKLMRNLSQHEYVKHHFLAFAEELFKALVSCGEEGMEFALESAGTLGNLPLRNLPNLPQILEEKSGLAWLISVFSCGSAQDDLILEAILLTASIAAHPEAALLLCNSGLLLQLIDLLKNKQEDDEIVLQIIYVFYQMCRHTETREYLNKKTDAPAYLIDLMTDNNAQIRRVCDSCMDIIKDDDPEYEERVKAEKFRSHNSHWLAMVENNTLETSLASISESAPSYTLLNQSLMMQTVSGSHMSLSNAEDIEIISNNANSDEGSRPLSRYESEPEELTDSLTGPLRGSAPSEDAVQNALRNLVISDESASHRYFHIDTPATPD